MFANPRSLVIAMEGDSTPKMARRQIETGPAQPETAQTSETQVDTEQVSEIVQAQKVQEAVQEGPETPMARLTRLKNTSSSKLYHCGFLYKRNQLGANGSVLRSTDKIGQEDRGGEWTKWWMELWGTSLHLWKCPQVLAGFAYEAHLPLDQFIANEFDPPLLLVSAIKSHEQTPITIDIQACALDLFNPTFKPAAGTCKFT